MDRDWRRIKSEVVVDLGIFRLRRDDYELRSRPVHPFHVIEAPPWVNVVAITEEREIVLVRQYRHGIRDTCLEVPGGAVDAADAGPAAAAVRELREETGYEAAEWRPLGEVTNNPAILDNRTHFFLASGARRVAEPAPDENEVLEVVLRPVGEIRQLIGRGEIHHSLCVCALLLAASWPGFGL